MCIIMFNYLYYIFCSVAYWIQVRNESAEVFYLSLSNSSSATPLCSMEQSPVSNVTALTLDPLNGDIWMSDSAIYSCNRSCSCSLRVNRSSNGKHRFVVFHASYLPSFFQHDYLDIHVRTCTQIRILQKWDESLIYLKVYIAHCVKLKVTWGTQLWQKYLENLSNSVEVSFANGVEENNNVATWLHDEEV